MWLASGERRCMGSLGWTLHLLLMGRWKLVSNSRSLESNLNYVLCSCAWFLNVSLCSMWGIEYYVVIGFVDVFYCVSLASNSQKAQCCLNQEGLGNTIILYKMNIFFCTHRSFCITIPLHNGTLGSRLSKIFPKLWNY